MQNSRSRIVTEIETMPLRFVKDSVKWPTRGKRPSFMELERILRFAKGKKWITGRAPTDKTLTIRMTETDRKKLLLATGLAERIYYRT
jgi:hypothetical protein